MAYHNRPQVRNRPYFSGQEDVDSFLEQYEHFVSPYNLQPREKFIVFKYSLQGTALQWYELIGAPMCTNSSNPFDEIVTLLLEAFPRRRYTNPRRQEVVVERNRVAATRVTRYDTNSIQVAQKRHATVEHMRRANRRPAEVDNERLESLRKAEIEQQRLENIRQAALEKDRMESFRQAELERLRIAKQQESQRTELIKLIEADTLRATQAEIQHIQIIDSMHAAEQRRAQHEAEIQRKRLERQQQAAIENEIREQEERLERVRSQRVSEWQRRQMEEASQRITTEKHAAEEQIKLPVVLLTKPQAPVVTHLNIAKQTSSEMLTDEAPPTTTTCAPSRQCENTLATELTTVASEDAQAGTVPVPVVPTTVVATVSQPRQKAPNCMPVTYKHRGPHRKRRRVPHHQHISRRTGKARPVHCSDPHQGKFRRDAQELGKAYQSSTTDPPPSTKLNKYLNGLFHPP